jgi:hypothetical protein
MNNRSSNFSFIFKNILYSKFSSSKKPQIPTENRLKNLEHVRERLDELEQIIGYYQNDEEQSDDAEPTTNNNTPKHLDKLSNELTAKRL